jgi:hypothetical protein
MSFRNALIAGVAWAASLAAQAAPANVNISVAGEISPGVYGRIDLGNAPPPPVFYPQPVLIVKQPRQAVVAQPVYLNVPPGHAKNWSKHCHRYNACGTPVYFVRTAEYEPGYRKGKHGDDRHEDRPGKGHQD